jgi:hypothetical protein
MAGDVIAPMLITKGRLILAKWLATTLPEQTLFACSDSGYTSDELGIDYIKQFDRCTRARLQGTHRILLFDGHGSHLIYNFVDYCQRHRIIPIALPPHTTHLHQPLDVGCFQPLKHQHSVAIESQVRGGEYTFDRVEFFELLAGIRNKAFLPNTIKSAWRKCGLAYPFNPSVVTHVLELLQTENERLARPKTPDQDAFPASSSLPNTPHRPADSSRRGRKLIGKIVPHVSEQILTATEAYIKGAIASSHSGQMRRKSSPDRAPQREQEPLVLRPIGSFRKEAQLPFPQACGRSKTAGKATFRRLKMQREAPYLL